MDPTPCVQRAYAESSALFPTVTHEYLLLGQTSTISPLLRESALQTKLLGQAAGLPPTAETKGQGPARRSTELACCISCFKLP